MEKRVIEIHQLLKQAAHEASPERVLELLSKAVHFADLEKDIGLQFETRAQHLLSSFRFGFHDSSLSTFPWLLDNAKKHPDIVNQPAMLILYMAVINGITEFPSISLAQVRQVLGEMEDWYLNTGYTLKEAYRIGRHTMLEMGREEEADLYLEKAKAAPSGIAINEATAFDAYAEITYADHLGDHSKAIKLAEPMLKGFPENPEQHAPFAALSTSFLAQDKLDQAIYCMVNAERHKGSLEYNHLWYGYKFLFILVTSMNLDAALNNFRQFIKRAAMGHAKGLSFLYYLSASYFLKTYSKEHDSIHSLRLPAKLAIYRKEGNYTCKELLSWIEDEIQLLAKGFDIRNENSFFTELIYRHKALEKFQAKEKIDFSKY
jgi:hypothetical protein